MKVIDTIENKKCDHCGEENAECLKLSGMLWTSFYLCQSCVSKGFRSFNKDK